MRLDKFFTSCGLLSRKECAKACRGGRIRVNGIIAKKSDAHIDPTADTVELDGATVKYKEFIYIMMNKPAGYVSTTDEPGQKPVTDLVDEKDRKLGLFPCGRLDKDTVGLLILTNDGVSAHMALSPKRHVEKTYLFECADPIDEKTVERLMSGVELADGYNTMECDISLTSSRSGSITLKEGKYHQIKRMFASTGNKITYLKRISFGQIQLDPDLQEGQWRYLNEQEEESFVYEHN